MGIAGHVQLMRQRNLRLVAALIMLLIVSSGCNETPPPVGTLAADNSDSVATVPTAIPATTSAAAAEPATPNTPTPLPTATPIPLVAQVNDEPLTQATYDRTLAQFQQWYPNGAPDGQNLRAYTLDYLVEQTLARQMAAANGLTVDPAIIEQRVAEATNSNGGTEGFNVWLSQNGFADVAAYRAQLESELMPQQVMQLLAQNLPTTAEQVRARYIQVESADLAQQLKQELTNGADFLALVQQHSIDPTKAQYNGDLGYFTRGTLFVPEIETAAFALDIFGISDVIAAPTPDGIPRFFIVQTLEKDGAVALNDQERAALVQERYIDWLAEQRAAADIVIFIELNP